MDHHYDYSLGFWEVYEASSGSSDSMNKGRRVSENLINDDQEVESLSQMEIDFNLSMAPNEENYDVGSESNGSPIKEVIYLSSDDDHDHDDDDHDHGHQDHGHHDDHDRHHDHGHHDDHDRHQDHGHPDHGHGHYDDHDRDDHHDHDHDDDDIDDEMVDRIFSEESAIDLELQVGINGGNSVGVELRSNTIEEEEMGNVNNWLSLSVPNQISQWDMNSIIQWGSFPLPPVLNDEPDWHHQAKKLKREKALRIQRVREDEEKFINSKVDPSTSNTTNFEDLNGSISAQLMAIIDRNTTRKRAERLTEWSAYRRDFRTRPSPALLDLSVNVIGKNPDEVSSFEGVPDWLKRRIVNSLCDARKMDVRILESLFKDSPTEIRVKNCSWMTEKQLVDVLIKSDLQNLRVLQLDCCGQCSFDDILCNSLALFPNSLVCLGILSLRAAGRLSDSSLMRLIELAPFLQSINLGQCSLLTSDGLTFLADYLARNLKELYLDQCSRIDAVQSLSSLTKFHHLEVLSVAEVSTVNDTFVTGITRACGGTLKELNLAGCELLTDGSLQAIANFCSVLCCLDVSNLNHVTDLGLCYLADGCRSLESLNIARAGFSDVAVAAFVENSGGSLKELSLNHVRKVSFNSAFALAKFSRKLVSLDLSWCRQVTDEALGFITDNCSSLKLLKIFGCGQITDTFVLGRANSQVHVLGRDSVTVLDHVKMFEPVEELLRYSSLGM